MKKIIFSIVILCGTHTLIMSQSIGIGTTSPNSSALLELRSTSKGLLIPRMNTAQKQGIVNKATGLLVYDTTIRHLSYWTGLAWQDLAASENYWNLSGNNISSSNAGNVGIGVSPLRAKLEVYGSPNTNYTAAMFGSGGVGIGITLENNRPAIGFNQYNNSGSRYMATGYATLQYFDVASGNLIFYTLGSGNADEPTNSINSIMTLASNGHVGIGYVEPGSPLSFANTLGNKISFWTNGVGFDYGIGLQADRLLIYTGNKIEMGSGDGNSFSNAFTFNAGDGSMYSKQSGNLNLVPLGAVFFRLSVHDCAIDESTASSTYFTNNAGSMVLSQTAGIPTCEGSTGVVEVESDLHLNPAITSQYSQIIAIGSPQAEFNPDALRYLYGSVSANMQSYYLRGRVDNIAAGANIIIRGHLLFYGIK